MLPKQITNQINGEVKTHLINVLEQILALVGSSGRKKKKKNNGTKNIYFALKPLTSKNIVFSANITEKNQYNPMDNKDTETLQDMGTTNPL